MTTTHPERIEYHETFLLDVPKKHGRSDYEATLLFDRVRPLKRGERRMADAVSFRGDTEDDVAKKMLAWIEKNGATEKASR